MGRRLPDRAVERYDTTNVASIIAVVDDEEAVRRALVRFFKAASFDARPFPSARAFLRSLDDTQFACLVIDLQMPEMTGLDLQRYLRMVHPHRRIPAIMITAHDEPGTREKCFAAGVAAYLRKPVEGNALLATVEELLRNPTASNGGGPPNVTGRRDEP